MPETTTRAGNPDLEVTLRDRHQPRATAGIYRAHVRHRLWDDDRNEAVDAPEPLPEVSQSYEIRAVQFSLDPAFVHSCYPAPGAVGRFTHVLAHVTLNRDVLPWERELKEATRVELRAPWLAVLVFAAGELPADPAAAGLTTKRSVRELLTPAPGVQIPGIDPDQLTDEVLDSACQTLDVPGTLFGHLVPREAELHYLAHVREVAEPRVRSGGEVLSEGQFAVVHANRLPRREGSYAVHLVSLEGFQQRLDPGAVPDGDLVRLCALHSWSFTCDQKGTLDVEGLLRNLAAPSLDDPENLALRLRPPTTVTATTVTMSAAATDRLDLGYVPVAHRFPTGHLSFAWYRGPGTPLAAQPLPADLPPGPHTTADHRLIYDETHGIFDVSYAAAWALGRAIGLADPDYTAQVTRVRRELAARATRLAALVTDPQRRDHDPDEVAGARAFAELAEGFGATVLRALAASRAPAPRRRRAGRSVLGRESLRAVLTDPRRQDLLRATVAARAGDMPDWLSRLAVLRGVPFCYLVPDPRMLPSESLRLFRVDPGWIIALLDGARDVGAHTSLDAALQPVLRDGLPEVPLPRAGLLISSELVRAWPDFDVTATVTGRPSPLPELRRGRLAPTVLLVLYDRVPDEVFIREPGQGIHFGLNSAGRIDLRQLDEDATPELGAPLRRDFPDPGTGRTIVDDHLRPAAGPDQLADVLDLRGPRAFVPVLAEALGRQDLRPSELALELVNAPYQQCLVPDTAGSAS